MESYEENKTLTPSPISVTLSYVSLNSLGFDKSDSFRKALIKISEYKQPIRFYISSITFDRLNIEVILIS